MSEHNEDVPDDCSSQGDHQQNRISIEEGVGLLISISKETSQYMNQLSSAFVQMNSGFQKLSENLASVVQAKNSPNNDNGAHSVNGASSKTNGSPHTKDSNQAKDFIHAKDSDSPYSGNDIPGSSKDKENGKPNIQ